MTADECLNREWVAANPGQSLEWARGMWWCGCVECEPPLVANGRCACPDCANLPRPDAIADVRTMPTSEVAGDVWGEL